MAEATTVPHLKMPLDNLLDLIKQVEQFGKTFHNVPEHFKKLNAEEILRLWAKGIPQQDVGQEFGTIDAGTAMSVPCFYLPMSNLENAHVIIQFSKSEVIIFNVHGIPRYTRLDMSIARNLCATIRAQTDQSVVIDLLAMTFSDDFTLEEKAGLVRCYNASRKLSLAKGEK